MADSLNCHLHGQANSGAQLPCIPESLSKGTGCGWAAWRNVSGSSTSEPAMLAQGWNKRALEILLLCCCITNCPKTYWLNTTMIISLGFVGLLGSSGLLKAPVDAGRCLEAHWGLSLGYLLWPLHMVYA